MRPRQTLKNAPRLRACGKVFVGKFLDIVSMEFLHFSQNPTFDTVVKHYSKITHSVSSIDSVYNRLFLDEFNELFHCVSCILFYSLPLTPSSDRPLKLRWISEGLYVFYDVHLIENE
jgi:hypothetical protein